MESDLNSQVGEYYQQTKTLKEEVRNLVLKSESLDEDLTETKLKLSASEGRVVGLENEIVKLESRFYIKIEIFDLIFLNSVEVLKMTLFFFF